MESAKLRAGQFYVHDSHVVAFTVDARLRQICLQAAYPEPNGPHFGTIVFKGVEAYRFEGDNLGTILLNIAEHPAQTVYEENSALFETERAYAWPGAWNTSAAAVLERIATTGVRAFVIHSAYGMTGWIWAQQMEVTSAAAPGP